MAFIVLILRANPSETVTVVWMLNTVNISIFYADIGWLPRDKTVECLIERQEKKGAFRGG